MTKQRKKQEPLSEALGSINEREFTYLTRRLRILLAKGRVENAVRAVREFATRTESDELCHFTSIYECGLPLALSNSLDRLGYLTLGSLEGVDLKALSSRSRMGEKGVDLIAKLLMRWKGCR